MKALYSGEGWKTSGIFIWKICFSSICRTGPAEMDLGLLLQT